jgi:hypothetical protein
VEPETDAAKAVWRYHLWTWLGPLLLVLGLCCVVPGTGVAIWQYTHRCVLRPDEAALVAAYSADPMIRAAKGAPSAGPVKLNGPCDFETGRVDGYVVVMVTRPVDTWRSSEQLAEQYRVATAAAGWAPARRHPDMRPEHPEANYCRTINGVPAGLTILLYRANGPQIFENTSIEARPQFSIGPGCS